MNILRSRRAPAFGASTLLLVFALAARLAAQEPRLANVSTLARVGTGADVLTAGFVIGGTAEKRVVIRGVGPGLTQLGVQGVLADPVLTVYGPDSSTTIAAQNDNWSSADAATFTSVGAFALPANSKDAAIVTSLRPGSYTASVSGLNNTTGTAIVEVYEAGTTGRFVNLSTRAQISAGTPLTPGFVVTAGGGMRKMLVRAAGPALSALGVGGALANPTLSVMRGNTVVANNDDWNSQVGTSAVSVASLQAAFGQAGAFAFPPNSRDAALLVDLAPGNYTLNVTGVGNTSGIAVVEVYDLTPNELPVITIAATKAQADETGSKNGEYTFTRTGPVFSPLTVKYGVGGSAINGYDYLALSGTITFPAGESTVVLPLKPNPDLQSEGTDTVVVTLVTDPTYLIGTQAAATVTIADAPATLYVASVRPVGTAVNSTASGTATILLSADGSLAAVTLSVSNLSANITSVHLQISPSGDFVLNLPNSTSGSAQWTFTPTGTYTSTALLEALKSGNIYVGIDTTRYPSGEARGSFILGAGSRTFTAPPAPPAVVLTNVTATDAARLLTQATFGPTTAEIEALTGGSIDTWITTQMAKPGTSHRTATTADRASFGGSNSYTNWNAIHRPNRESAWWKVSLTAEDQLRQRVAFALSQIFVVSDQALGDDSRAEPLAAYYDMLVNGAFGNFRTLLENVTLHPLMGEYLSSLRNSKATFDAQGNLLTTPDENYAREVMQLFTIGLVMLQPDGTLSLGADGLPIATYDQTTITEVAKVFTGWGYFTASPSATNFRSVGANYFTAMTLYPAFHDTGAKNIVNGVIIPASTATTAGTNDLRIMLDTLFTHPNTAPFISKLLIQRLVTSNPSPAYVYRVAQKFENNGSGTRGDLGAVVRAILTDYEARSPEIAANASFGKLKEPVLRLTSLLRGFGATSTSGRYLGYRHTLVDGTFITSTTPLPAVADRLPNTTGSPTVNSTTIVTNALGSLAQAPLRSPTVFNFYHPDYVLPGALAAAGLVVPEFEITDDNYAISVPNYLRPFILGALPTVNGAPVTAADPYTLRLNTTAEQALVATPAALLDRLNLLLCAGSMPAATRTRITTAMGLPTTATAQDRVNTAILLTLTSPSSAIQK